MECGKTAESPCRSFNFVWSQIEHIPSLWSIVKLEYGNATLENMWDQNRATFKEYVNETINKLKSLQDFDCLNTSASSLNSVCDQIQFNFLKSQSNGKTYLPNEYYLENLWKSCDDGKQMYQHEISKLCSDLYQIPFYRLFYRDDEESRKLLDSRANKIYNQIKNCVIFGLEQLSFNLVSDSDILIDRIYLNTGSNNDTRYHISVEPKNHTIIEMNVKDSIISKFTFYVNTNQISLQVQNCSFKESVFEIFSKKDSINLPVMFNNCKFYGDVYDSVIQIENAQNVSLLSCSFLELHVAGSTNIPKSQDSFVNEQTKCLALLICSESQIEIQDISFSDISLSYSESCLIHLDKCNITFLNITVQNTSVYSTFHGIIMLEESTLFIDGISFRNNYIEVASVFYTHKSILTIKYGTFDNNTIGYKLVNIASDSFGIIDSSEFLNNIGNSACSENPDYSKSLIKVTRDCHLVLQNSYFRKGIIMSKAVIHCDMNASIAVVNSTFSNNIIASVSFDTCNASVLLSKFVDNHVFRVDIVKVSRTEFVLMDSILSNNSVDFGNILSISKSNSSIQETVFSRNNMSFGRILKIYDSNANITGTVFSRNNMSSSFTLYFKLSNVNITGSVFSHNNRSMIYGHLIEISQCKVNIIETMFADNSIVSGHLVEIIKSKVNITRTVFSLNNVGIGSILAISSECIVNITGTVFSLNNVGIGSTETVFSLNNVGIGSTGTVFSFNNISSGQLLHIGNSNVSITGTVFSHNSMVSGHVLEMYQSRANINITGSVFSNNTLSGPYSVLYSATKILNLYIIDCTFEYNVVQKDGHIVQFRKNSAIRFFNCIFLSNHAHTGSIGSFIESNVVLAQSLFRNNSASQNGGILSSKESVVTVKNCTMLGNKAAGDAGVFYVTYHSLFLIEDTLFQNNSCVLQGGVIKAYRNNTITITNSSFTNNKATASNAGTILLENECSLTTENCTFLENVAASKGGAILVLDHSKYQDTGSHFIRNTASDVGWYFS